MQATAPALDGLLTADLYALVTHLHKTCTGELLEAVGTLELTISQTKLLHRLEIAGRELSLGEAADSVGLTLSTASRLVDELVHRGLVGRREDATDRRLKRIGLTDAGRAVLRRLAAARMAGLSEFVATLDGTERDCLAAALRALLARPEIAACRYPGAAA